VGDETGAKTIRVSDISGWGNDWFNISGLGFRVLGYRLNAVSF